MNYIICRMANNKLPEQWNGVIIKVCRNFKPDNIGGDIAFEMCKSPEECYKILKNEYKGSAYKVYMEGNNVVITDVL